MSVRHSARSLGPLISTRSAMPSIEKSASWRWTWIFASGYTSSWGYLYPKGTDIYNERGCRQGRKASPVSEQSPPEQTAWDSQKLMDMNRNCGPYMTKEEMDKISILGALDLYLDFVNIFLYLLRLFANAKNNN